MSAEHVAVISRDAGLTAEVRRLAALAGRSVAVAGRPADCARVARAAALVVLDAAARDLVDDSVQLGDVVVVTDDLEHLATWELAVRVGARRVLTMPADAAQLLDLLALAGERPGLPGPLVGVVGGAGGAGASVLAVALGWAFGQAGRPTSVVDLDVCGGGLDVLAGLERAEGLRWRDLVDARGVVASASLRAQLPTIGGLAVLSAASAPGESGAAAPGLPGRAAMTSVLAAARRGGDVVVADVPRYLDDDVCSVIAGCDAMLLVVPAQVRAVAAAAGVACRLRSLCNEIHLVVRKDDRGRLHERDVADALGLTVAATVRTESRLNAAVERGLLVPSLRKSGLARVTQGLVARLCADVVEQAS